MNGGWGDHTETMRDVLIGFSKRGKLARKIDLVNLVERVPLSRDPWQGRKGFFLGRWDGDRGYLTRRWKQLAGEENFQDRQGEGNII